MFKDMTKSELVEAAERLQAEVEQLRARGRRSGSGRKVELLEIMAAGGGEMLDIANKMGITTKNLSSLFHYLKKDGWTVRIEDGIRTLVKFKGAEVDKAFIEEFIRREKVVEASEASE